jgi:hypothetical protein
MSESELDNQRQAEIDRRAIEAVGHRLRDILIDAGFMPASEPRPPEEPWELGRLLRAFVRVDDAGVRTEVIALVEALGLLRSESDPLGRG